MRFLIVSHTPHYRLGGEIVGWGATLREIDYLATLFDEVVHVAPLHDEPAPASSLPYTAANVCLVPVRPAGGAGLQAKLGILAAWFDYARVIVGELRRTDAVHVRCPANISLLALLLLTLRRRPEKRWIKYAGNWQPVGPEPFSYRFQRWLLTKNRVRARVTVNGSWPGQPEHVASFVNPCLTEDEISGGIRATELKRLDSIISLLFVGRLESEKGVLRILDICGLLKGKGVAFRMDLVGDGPQRAFFEQEAEKSGLGGKIIFHGWLTRSALNPLYKRAHFFLLPSDSEGWPKVLSEAMAYGVVPLASNVGSISQFLGEFGTGRCFPPSEVAAYAEAIEDYLRNPARWSEESGKACNAAARFTYQGHLERVRNLLEL